MNRKLNLSLIFLMSTVFLSGCTIPVGNFEYAGDKESVTVPKSTHTTVILDFQLAVGSITLVANPTATDMVLVTNQVSIREGSDGSMAEAEEVLSSEIDSETMKIQFDSQDEGLQVDYKYDITITVASNITLQIDLKVATGDISTSISDATITIHSLDLETTTGSISLTLEAIRFSDTSPKVQTTTGHQDLTISSIIYSVQPSWNIYATTGNVDLGITDTRTLGNVTETYRFNIEVTTGTIGVIADLHQDFGVKIITRTTTGNITIPGGLESYTSSNYDLATHHYDFDLDTTTGGITFSTGS